MPLRDDLIERTLEQLAEVVRSLMGLHSVQAAAQAEQLIQEAYRQHTGSEAGLLKRLPSDQLIQVLSSAGHLDREKAFLMASLFRAEEKLHQATQQETNVGQLNKALDLYLEAALAELDVADVDTYIAELTEELEPYALPVTTQWRLFDYALFRNQLAVAEDQLFGLLEQLGPTPELAVRGRRFYQELKLSSDDRLEAGDLPRAEVEEGSSAFEERLAG